MVEHLSSQERRILELAADGQTDKGIALAVGISVSTVATYWLRIRAKTGLRSRAEMVGHFVANQAKEEVEALRERHARREEDLHKDLEHLNALIDAAPEAMLIVQPDGTVLAGNKRASEILECRQNHMEGLRVGQFMPPEAHQMHAIYREQYLKDPNRVSVHGGEPVDVLTCKGRTVKCMITLNMAESKMGKAVVVMLIPVGVGEAVSEPDKKATRPG